MISVDKVKKLLQAYRDYDDTAFVKTAEAIIEDTLASNKMSEAKELKRALGEGHKDSDTNFKMNHLSMVPLSNRSDSKLFDIKISDIDANQVVLSADCKKKIDRIVQEHKNKNTLHQHGLKAKSKLLFWGPPGCGKTLTSMYLAHELGLPIATVQISSLISSYMGDTSNHIQKVFDYANKNPIILFLDEFDAVGKTRGDSQDVGEIKRIVNSVLQSFDSFTSDKSILIAASNYQDILDEALWRRFDDIVSFPKPSKSERERFLSKLFSGVKFQGSLSKVAAEIKNLSFAEIERIVKESLKSFVMQNSKVLTYVELKSHLDQYQTDLSAAQKTKVTKARRK